MDKSFSLKAGCFIASGLLMAAFGSARAADSGPFLGHWALTVPGGAPGWLGVTQERGYYDGSLLWVAGSVEPVSSVFFNDDTLYVTRVENVERRNADGKVIRTQQFTDLITAKVYGDEMTLHLFRPRRDGEGIESEEFSGKRIPPVPPAPDLSSVEFGAPIRLFNGESLDGWRLTEQGKANGWSVHDGILQNKPVQHHGQTHIDYGNLRTDREFTDFNLKLEVRVPKDGNSGVYLRGIYEVQVADTYGQPTDSHNMGALYSRITPRVAAEKPAGEWQTLDITLVKRHLTVILNGVHIIDNQPVLGCTGGALRSDEFRPGPIYLQGDHAGVEYRHIVLRPVVN
jgi:hypothetical protein